MAQIQKVELATQVKSSADKFYAAIRDTKLQLTKITPQINKSIEILEGDVKTVGSITLWKYCMNGGSEVLAIKEKIVAVDDENRSMAFQFIEGDIMNFFNSLVLKFNVTPKGEEAMVKWSMEYEKANENVPAPNAFLEMLVNFSKTLDAHLLLKE